MGIVPENTRPRIAWYGSRLATWAENASELGLPADDVALLEEKIAAAKERLEQQTAAHEAAKVATSQVSRAMDELSQLGALMIDKIKLTARMRGNGIYDKALMLPPAEPSPIGAPGMPSGIKAVLEVDGSLLLKWKCKNPKHSEGTMYEIHRQIENGEAVPLGTVGKKEFLDEFVPPGAKSMMYSIRAIRSTRRGEVATFNVFLGARPGRISRYGFLNRGDDKNAA